MPVFFDFTFLKLLGYGLSGLGKAWTLRRQDTESEGISNLKNRVIREIRAEEFVLFVCLTWSKQI